MRPTILASLLAFALPAAALAMPGAPPGQTAPAYVTTAMNDPARGSDRDDDARRQMAAVMAFAEVKPGQKVLELAPGSGYWTRVFSAIVGPAGRVYTVWPDEMWKHSAKSYANWQKLVATAHYGNVSLLKQPAAELSAPAKVDLVFTVQNYHDYHDAFMGPVDMAKFDKLVYDALKPSGVFVVIDHVAPAGSGLADTDTLHRIDPAVVKKEVESAGFVFDGESDALRNPADSHTAKVFDPSIRGHTDQFIYRFRKPAK
ncbi:class I SAM-dependent methyltransferase [Rhodanobacter sp. 7MK24]|uniref:class I SAM-dependent methyltransferase n=1 Tax=Rhodanobacter sp. 7MK24 TaxID=2775922 RepID=UPI001784D81E|nr:class I SAM-dependent methyltransferase [Rhodanobacter sp. 7MK24]MBD8882085.1 class I SAM-dependent methyltransferase [Rhodanobacter sp. 7MK24]